MRRLSLMAIAVVLCAALGGCTDEKKVGPIDDPSTTSSPSPTPSEPTAPPLPADAKGDNVDAAVAFTKHYIRLLNYAANTGDVAPLRSASRNCGGCNKYIKLYETTYANGGYVRDPGWRPASPLGREEGPVVTIVTEVKAPAVTAVERRGAEPSIGVAATYSLRFQARYSNGAWNMTLMTGD